MTRTLVAPILMLAALTGGCTLIVDEQLASKDAGTDTGVPSGPPCNSTDECLTMSGRITDCSQQCVGASAGSPGVCVAGTAEGTPDGTPCGDGTRICALGMCVVRECGDGFLDRAATPPEYCDDGDDNDTNLCNNSCTRSCVPPARPDCSDGDPCNGLEMCDSGSGLCRASRPAADGVPCMSDGQSGSCRSGTCVVD